MKHAWLLLVWAGGCAAPGPVPRPAPGVANLLLVTIDTLRADHVGAIGYPRETTPNLDRLAARSALFTQAIAQSSWTRASMASLVTGLYPTTVGLTCHNFRVPKKECDVLPDSALTLAELLRARGLRTASIVANINVDAVFGFGQGFDELHVVSAGLSSADPDWRLHDDWFDRTTREVTERALEWLAGAGDEPFLLNLHYLDPHHPYEPPAPHREAFDARLYAAAASASRESLARYDGEIRFVDEQLQRVVEALERSGTAARTMIVVLADHGEEFGDHGGIYHGFTMYDEQIRVPLILHVPGLTDAGRIVAQQVRLLDVLPTVAELLAAPVPAGVQGRSLVPLLHGEPAPVPAALSEWGYRPFVSWRVPPWKLIYDIEAERAALYHLERDPAESADCAADEPALVSRLTGELTDELAEAIAARKGLAAESGTVELDAEQIERLQALGYVDGS